MQALRAFEAAARTGSLTKAADALSVTHGAISHQIKSLEATLGVRLVERAGRGIRVTDDGARLATRLRAALAEIADALREVSERSNPRQLRGTATSTSTFARASRSSISVATTPTSRFVTASAAGPTCTPSTF